MGDSKAINLGADQDTTLTHVPDSGVLLNSTRYISFSDANSHISNPGAGLKLTDHAVIEVEAATSIQMDSPIVDLEDDGVILQFGADDDVTLTHVPDVGLLMNSDNVMRFRDAAISIGSADDGVLDITSDGSIDMNVGAAGVVIKGTVPKITIGDTGAEDTILAFDGNQVDFHVGLDDTDDKLKIGLGLVPGTTPSMTLASATRDVTFHGDIQIDGKDIKNSVGTTAITLNTGGEVLIPGDLTVKGTTTTVDTTNLAVEDRFIGLNVASGSISGGAVDVGFIFDQARGDNPAKEAFYFDQSEARFKILSTNSPASGSSITDGTFRDLEIADLWLGGGDLKNDTATALALSAGANPDVTVSNDLLLLDDNFVKLGTANEVTMRYNETGAGTSEDKFEVLMTGGEGMNFSVPASKSYGFAVNNVPRLIVIDSGIQVDGAADSKIEASTGKDLLLQGVASQDVRVDSEQLLKFADGNDASWADQEGIKLSTNVASWTSFEAAFGDGTSLLDAIVQAKGSGAAVGKRAIEIASAGTNAELNLDLSDLAIVDWRDQVDIYLNGQLMVSGSSDAGTIAAPDYALDKTDGANSVDATFTFNLVVGDVVVGVIR